MATPNALRVRSTHLDASDDAAQEMVAWTWLRRSDGQTSAILDVPHVGQKRPWFRARESGTRGEAAEE